MADKHLHAQQQCCTPSSQDLGGQADGWGQVYHLTHALTLKTLSVRLPAAGIMGNWATACTQSIQWGLSRWMEATALCRG